MDRTKFENGMNERQGLDIENGEVAALLSTLPRVEAPGDFDFGVKARIAATSSRPRTSFLPFLKVAAPLSLLLMVGAFVLLYGTLPGNTPVGPVAEVSGPLDQPTSSKPEPAAVPQLAIPVSTPQVDDRSGEQVAVAIPNQTRRIGPVRRVNRVQPISVSEGGSIDSTLRIDRVIEAPPDVPVRDILEKIGMKAEFVDGGWKVLSTTDNSIATRSGVRSDDVIEAVDGRPITEATTLKGGVEGKRLTVRREGKQVKLDLKN